MLDVRRGEPDFQVRIVGEQYWWRVQFMPSGDRPGFETANEFRLPAGASVELILDSADVIHSFWVPPLAGKVDMIPGRTNRLLVEPTRPGLYRGQCAEFCGLSHAYMSLLVEISNDAEFDAWRKHQTAVAAAPADRQARRGQQLFLAAGCGGCHTIRGTAATGTIGPDLTHFASRGTLGAVRLPNEPDHVARWIADTDDVKSGTAMPAFGFLAEADLDALVAYLGGLE